MRQLQFHTEFVSRCDLRQSESAGARRQHRCDPALEQVVQGEFYAYVFQLVTRDPSCRYVPDSALPLIGLFDTPMRFREPFGAYYACMTTSRAASEGDKQ